MFADARHGGVFRLGLDGSTSMIVEHRRGIGGLVLHDDGGLVVTGRNLAYKAAGRQTAVLVDRDEEQQRFGFNDLTTDGRGRIYAGSVAFNGMEADLGAVKVAAGSIYLVELDGSVRRVADDIKICNGVALSPDGATLYMSDTGRQVVFAYDVDPESGDLSNRRVLLQTAQGRPDGIAVAQDGTIWLALAFAGKVVRYDASGQERETIDLPTPMVTSLCFARGDAQTLYIVTGVEERGSTDRAHVFSIETDVPGAAVAPARVRVAQAA
ncbi:SMP-30/gluconolactonase/LRE family protein [Streptomyces sp. NPDC047081]|uniref:SMP-30/gluconolactonase/LRE family protein n=1 Tax=Streptomyces sp. NPDC047081 TaxID=3154706 RepID=UPI0034049C0E